MDCFSTKFNILIAVKKFGSWTFASSNSKVFTFICFAVLLRLVNYVYFLTFFSGSFFVNFVFHDFVTARNQKKRNRKEERGKTREKQPNEFGMNSDVKVNTP